MSSPLFVPNAIRYSQATVTLSSGAHELSEWNSTLYRPILIVIMEDNIATSCDNRRLLRAKRASIPQILTEVHPFSEPVINTKFDCYLIWKYNDSYVAIITCRPVNYGQTIRFRCALNDMDLDGRLENPEEIDERQNFFRYIENENFQGDIDRHDVVCEDFSKALVDKRTIYYAPSINTSKFFPIIKKTDLFSGDLGNICLFFRGSLRMGEISASGLFKDWDADTHDAHDQWLECESQIASLQSNI